MYIDWMKGNWEEWKEGRIKTKKVGRKNFTEGNNIDYGVQIVAVGDATVGKTPLLETYMNGEFSYQVIPTVFEIFVATIEVSFTL